MDMFEEQNTPNAADEGPSNNRQIGQPLKRLTTGITGLDSILQGGLVRTGIYIIMGAPGAGKTVMANQICFNHLAGGGRALYVTLLAETHSRMLRNLQLLQFFDPTPVGEAITYLSGYGVLTKDGLRGLTELIRKEIRQRQTSLLVLDGLMTAQAVSDSELDFKSFIDQLHGYTEVNGCTTLLLSHRASQGDTVYRPEYTMVDGIIELYDLLQAERSVRELYVSKLRGSDYLRGRHPFTISDQGIVVYPRTEALLAQPSEAYVETNERRAFGIERLDQMLAGSLDNPDQPPPALGLLANSVTMMLGVPGTGKTILGLSFLAAGAAQEQKGLFFSFHETPAQILTFTRGLGLNGFEKWVENGQIQINWQPPLGDILDILAERLLIIVRGQGIKRLVIDSFQGFNQSVHPERLTRFFTALNNELRALGVTTLLIVEAREIISSNIQLPSNPVSSVFDNIIFLRHVELHSRLYKMISIIKERGSAFDATIRQVIIEPSGVRVGNSLGAVENALTGVAHETERRAEVDQPGINDELPKTDLSFEQ